MIDDPVSALTLLVEAERAALTEGRFADLPALVAAKERVVALLTGVPPAQAAALAAVLAGLSRNQRLIDASIQGVQAARQRFAAMRDAATGMTAYTAEGRTRRIGAQLSSVEKRA